MLESVITQRVRYGETDKMGVVYYGNYLVWFEVGRTHHFRTRGVTYAEIEAAGLFLPVSEVSCKILQPARYDDEVQIRTSLAEIRSRALTLAYRIESGGNLLAEGKTVHVCVNGEQKVTKIPDWIRAKLDIEQRTLRPQ